MSHKTLVNGTVYEVGGGKTLIDGVAYSIDKGKTLVGGTAYEVGFAPSTAIVTMESDITGNYSFGSFYVGYSTADEPYGSISTVGTYELPIGTVIRFEIKADKGYNGTIYLNDEYVDSGDSLIYSYPLNGNITVSCMSTPFSGLIYITEE